MRNARREIFEIGKPIRIEVEWYDHCAPGQGKTFEGEVIGWRTSQVIIAVKGYGTIRCWKRNGIEVSNRDHERRGFRIEMSSIQQKPAKGVDIQFSEE